MMNDYVPRNDPPRAPRTFEIQDDQWVETGSRQPVRPSPWLLVPLVLMAATFAVFAIFAVLAALVTGGLFDLRRRVLAQGAELRRRFTAFRRR